MARLLLIALAIVLVAGAFLAGSAIRNGGDVLTANSGTTSRQPVAMTTSQQIAALQERLTKTDDLDTTTTLAGLYVQQALLVDLLTGR